MILRRFLKFSAVGVFNTAVDFTILNLLSWLTGIYAGLAVAALNIVSFLVAVTNSYFLNKFWTFKNNTQASLNEYITFVSVILVGVFVNSLIVYLFTTFIQPPFNIHPQFWLNGAKIIALPVSTLWNFLSSHKLVFRNLLS